MAPRAATAWSSRSREKSENGPADPLAPRPVSRVTDTASRQRLNWEVVGSNPTCSLNFAEVLPDRQGRLSHSPNLTNADPQFDAPGRTETEQVSWEAPRKT